MKPTAVNYPENQASVQKVKSFVLANLPDYSTNIDSVEKLEEFRSANGE